MPDGDSDDECQDLTSLIEVRVDTLNGLEGDVPEWEEIEFMVDSGAGATVIPPDEVKAVEAKESTSPSQYKMADGSMIPERGMKTFTALTEDEQWRTVNARITDVDKPLLSVSQIVRNGGATVVFSPEGGYIKSPGRPTLPMELRNNVYHLKMWVPKEQGEPKPFHGRT